MASLASRRARFASNAWRHTDSPGRPSASARPALPAAASLFAALLLAACSLPPPRDVPEAAGGGAPGSAAASNSLSPTKTKTYLIDEPQSELRILVYRAGPLARLGHNHVMVNRTISGSISLDAAGATLFSLHVPAAAFLVDDAQARREEGAEFAADIPDDAKSGTLRNMLSKAVLDAGAYPVIIVNGVAVAAGADNSAGGLLTARVAISVAGHESKIDVPFQLETEANHSAATGSMELSQSALGLTPYNLMLGALQVKDVVKVKFRIAAHSS